MMEHQQHFPYNSTSRPASKLPPSYLPPPSPSSSTSSSPLPNKYTTIERKHFVRMTSNGPIDDSGHEDRFVPRSNSNVRPRDIHQAHRDINFLDFDSSSHISQLLDRLDSLSLSNLSQLSSKPHSSSRVWPPVLSRENSHGTNRHGNNSTSGYDTNSSSSLLSGYFYPLGSSCALPSNSTIRRIPSVPNLRPSSAASSSMASSSGSSNQYNNTTSTNASVQPENFANKPKVRPNSMHIGRQTVTLKDDVIKATDKIEKRVAFLREVAQELLSERNKLENAIQQVRQCCLESHFSDVDFEEISAAVGALERRLGTVNIEIRTPRSTEQIEALTRANRYLDELRELARNKPNTNNNISLSHGNGKDLSPHWRFARQRCLSYISSCSSDGVPETPATPIDEKFQRTVIECTAEDQKQIRRTLEAILSQLNQNDKS